MIEMQPQFESIVLQPTTVCNINCSYCYLPNRNKKRYLSEGVIERVVEAIWNAEDTPISVVWHGGEPLSAGIERMSCYFDAFKSLQGSGKVVQCIQTNATLINEDWCKLFIDYNIKIGVSIDGPVHLNTKRVGWNRRPAYDAIMKGIECLKSHNIPFTAIAVVGENSVDRAVELYDFFVNLGCYSFGVNIEELEGTNRRGYTGVSERVKQFWGELFSAWKDNPKVKIREFLQVVNWSTYASDGKNDFMIRQFRSFPSIACNGDVVLLSPEFQDSNSEKYDDFVVGNILEKSLQDIIRDGISSRYVSDYTAGVIDCMTSCSYFSFCGGGQAANKYFETGSTRATATQFCRNSKMSLLDAIADMGIDDEFHTN